MHVFSKAYVMMDPYKLAYSFAKYLNTKETNMPWPNKDRETVSNNCT